MSNTLETDVVVIGSGPGGYTAAFRAADLGLSVALVERYDELGGTCLNVGCIPSKALLHVAKVMDDVKDLSHHGVQYGAPKIDIEAILTWKSGVVGKLTAGLSALAKARKVKVIHGSAKFKDANTLTIDGKDTTTVSFKHAIIAVGSESVSLPFIPEDPRIFSSTGALRLADIKGDLLVLGGGIIGLEMATVYAALGVKVTVVEFMDRLIPAADKDLTNVLQKHMAKKGVEFLLKTKVTAIDAKDKGLEVTLEGTDTTKRVFQQILVAVGRKPNGGTIDAQKAGVKVDEKGFIPVDKQLRTSVSHIFAIGDVIGQPMLAHKAMPEGKLAAEVIAGKKHAWDVKCIPSVAYTDPELAWVGLTEEEAKSQNIAYEKAVFPWAASGRALSMTRSEGLTKLIVCPKTERVLGGGIVGVSAGELIAEIGLAIEMGANVGDIALTIHPHPSLSESIAQSAEIFEGTITDLYMPKKKSPDTK